MDAFSKSIDETCHRANSQAAATIALQCAVGIAACNQQLDNMEAMMMYRLGATLTKPDPVEARMLGEILDRNRKTAINEALELAKKLNV